MVGLACCVMSLIDARGHSLLGPDAHQRERGEQAAMPHLMRGWARTPPNALWWPDRP
jgi:hypothetical protein